MLTVTAEPISPPLSRPDEATEVSAPDELASGNALEVIEVLKDLTVSAPGELVSCDVFLAQGRYFVGFHDHYFETGRVYHLTRCSRMGMRFIHAAVYRVVSQYLAWCAARGVRLHRKPPKRNTSKTRPPREANLRQSLWRAI